MKTWLVTVKLPRNPAHNPHNKVTGPCPVDGRPCTDMTGQHHTVAVMASDRDGAALWAQVKGHTHITRIEGGW